MRNRIRPIIGLIVVLAFACPPASAQRRPAGPQFDDFPFDGPGFLKVPLAERGPRNRLITAAANKRVQKELGLSDEVSKKLTSLRDDFPASARARYAEAEISVNKRTFSDLESQQIRAIQSRLIIQSLEEIQQLLSPEQFKRLKQIRVQWYGIAALRVPDLAAELKLTDDQVTKVNDLHWDFNERINRVAFAAGENVITDSKTRTDNIAELQREQESQLLKVLTAEQQTQFAAMKGTAFDWHELNQDELRAAGMLASPPTALPAK
jgi:hypothetical protein